MASHSFLKSTLVQETISAAKKSGSTWANQNYNQPLAPTIQLLPVLGTCTVITAIKGSTTAREKAKLNVAGIPGLSLLGRGTITQLNIDVNQILKGGYTSLHTIGLKSDKKIQKLKDVYSIE